MAVRVLARVIFGDASSYLHVVEPRLRCIHPYPTRICIRQSGLFRCTHTSQSNAEKAVQQQRDSDVLRPKAQSQYNALIDSAKNDHQHLTSHEQFSLAVDQYLKREKYRRGHVGFIRLALQRMDEFGLQNDLATYNKLLDVFPKDRFKPHRMLDALWPRSLPQMELALELLTKMEENGVNPSLETYQIVKDVFGGMSFPLQKCIRLMYLFDKYENADPYRIKGELPTDPVELARLTLKRIAGSNGHIIEHKIPAGDVTMRSPFLLSASTELQVKHLQTIGDPKELLFHVEGPHRIWLHKVKQHYFSLKLSRRDSSSELMDEGAVLGVCMCEPVSQQSLQDWLGALQETYPSLSKVTVVYNIRRETETSSGGNNLQLPPHTTRLSSGENINAANAASDS